MSSLFTCIEMRLLRLILLAAFFTSTLAMAQSIERAIMPGEVIEGHKKYEEDCAKCHRRFDRAAQDGLCLDCHKEIATAVNAKRGLHGHLDNTACRNCHSDHKGRAARIATVDPQKFDHAITGFKLQGGHKKTSVKCGSCHQPKKKYREVSTQCGECHRKDDQEKGHKGKLGSKCETCHNDKEWKDAKFDHEKTKFSLRGGKHAEVKCRDCHADNTFQKTPTTCAECHKKVDQEKGHKGRFGSKCESCHSDKDWKETKFDHDTDTHYVLKGKHRQAKCTTCHLPEKGQIYQVKWPTKCVACHAKDDQEKGHRGGLGEKCESCHNERGWKQTVFDHDDTKFPLRFKHRDAKCDSCHKGGISGPNAKLKLETKCFACHKKDDQEKGHRGGLGEKCESCHNERGWKQTKFDHDDTKFPLRFKHKEAKCESCHKGGVSGVNAKIKLETQCHACHQKEDQEKGHKGRYGTKCESCHVDKEWKTIIFSHDKDTKFVLKAKHRETRCDDCHLPAKGAIYEAKLDMACIGCHRKDDKHRGQLGTKCESCHTEGKWLGTPFDHNKSRFRLTGSHVKVECKKCHQTPAFRDAPSVCGKCHEKEDKHQGAFGNKCDRCHYTGTWQSWDFDHGTTRFRIDGAHKKLVCEDCHGLSKSGKAGTPGRSCFSCHGNEDPHNGGFGIQCEQCHVTSEWGRLLR